MSDFEDGDVYMSSHEHRFRMFSSVEYEGQLYMTPQNFIESVTMSEPRSTLHSYYTWVQSSRPGTQYSKNERFRKKHLCPSVLKAHTCWYNSNLIIFITLVPCWPDIMTWCWTFIWTIIRLDGLHCQKPCNIWHHALHVTAQTSSSCFSVQRWTSQYSIKSKIHHF